MELYIFNPWWKSSIVPEELVGKPRGLLAELFEYLDYRQMLLLFGIRRAGKTTLMYQLIDHLLRQKQIPPFQILYFSFDVQEYPLNQILEAYQIELLKSDLRSQTPIYLFIDEIQKHPQWSETLKVVYDQYPNVKIIVSGSSALPLQKGAKESLAGRFFEFHVTPLSLDEFLEFTGTSIDPTREQLYEREIKIVFQEYLSTGGFIEAIPFPEKAREKYFKESLLERVIYKDIPEIFQIDNPGMLFRIISILAGTPGMYLDYKHLGNDLQVDQRTIANYVSYLTYALFVTKLYNYSSNRLTSEKKLKRAYLSNTAFLEALRPDQIGLDRLLETYFVNALHPRFFYRSPQQEEVDIVLDNQYTVVPVEIKIRETIRPADCKSLLKFMRHFSCQQGLMISKNDERTIESDNHSIKILPYWKYWSIRQTLTNLLGE